MNNVEDIKVKYPKELYSAFTGEKVLSVTAHLAPADISAGTSPYKIYEKGRSRFVFSIVNTKEKTYPSGNIRIDEIAGIIANTRSAQQIDMFANIPVLHQLFKGIKEIQKAVHGVQEGIRIVYNSIGMLSQFIQTGKVEKQAPKERPKNAEEQATLAKTVMINNGRLKGKTPFQVLAENPKQVVDLEKQRDWLKSNLERFPDNQKQINAIEEALDLFKSGKLGLGDVASGDRLTFGTIPLYEPTPRALIREKDENGFCPVYEVAINWHVGERYPVEVRVKRYKAPVVKQESGSINPQRSEAVEIQDNSFKLTSGQWLECTRLMESTMSRFEYLLAARQFREAEEIEQALRGM